MVNEKFEILRLLIENQGNDFSIREISKIREINYKSAYLAIKNLELEGVINLNRVGNTVNCSFNRKFGSLVFDVEYFRRLEVIKNKNFAVVNKMLNGFKFPFIALLFGSFVNKKNSKNSDIDLLVISENQNEVKRQLNLIPLDIHLTLVSYDEFISMLKSREFNVVSEVVKKNVILFGIEEYYHFLEVGLNVS